MANSIGIGSAAGECRDYTGRTIQHAMHFVPPGVDMCKLCICENGHAKVRVVVFSAGIVKYQREHLFRLAEQSYALHHPTASPFKWAHRAVNLFAWTIR